MITASSMQLVSRILSTVYVISSALQGAPSLFRRDVVLLELSATALLTKGVLCYS